MCGCAAVLGAWGEDVEGGCDGGRSLAGWEQWAGADEGVVRGGGCDGRGGGE